MKKVTNIDDILKLRELAEKKGCILYNICFRRAGVGIMWYDLTLVETEIPEIPKNLKVVDHIKFLKEQTSLKSKQMKEGLTIYSYYESLEKMIEEEIKRLKELPDL
ncbi:MAG: hypothetical protein ACFFG0_04095 [Candidatus Thorarchaeota archaeon]